MRDPSATMRSFMRFLLGRIHSAKGQRTARANEFAPTAFAILREDLRVAARPGRRPQLFEVVIRARGGLHDVDDDIAAVDQHPFAGLLALDTDDARARSLERIADMLSKRLLLPGRIG